MSRLIKLSYSDGQQLHLGRHHEIELSALLNSNKSVWSCRVELSGLELLGSLSQIMFSPSVKETMQWNFFFQLWQVISKAANSPFCYIESKAAFNLRQCVNICLNTENLQDQKYLCPIHQNEREKWPRTVLKQQECAWQRCKAVTLKCSLLQSKFESLKSSPSFQLRVHVSIECARLNPSWVTMV